MKNQIKHLVFALALLATTLNPLFSTAFAQGSLTPPGPPGPTMVTLSQIEPRTPIGSLPYTITQPGSYYVTANLTGIGGGTNGITILTNDVSLDLCGFTLLGVSGSGNGINVPNVQTNLVIRNGVLDSWGNDGVNATNANNSQFERLRVSNSGGFRGDGLGAGTNCVVLVCTVSGNGTGIYIGNNSTVKDCTASGNGTGIFTTGTGCTVTTCTASGNSGYGIFTGDNCTVTTCTASGDYDGGGVNLGNNCTVKGCTADDDDYGIAAQNNCTVSDCTANNGVNGGITAQNNCTVSDCTGAGTTANGGIVVQSGCSISGCNAYGNEASGIGVGSNSTVKNCTSTGNTGNGIYIGGPGGWSLIEGNNVSKNSGYGIYPAVVNVTNSIVRNLAAGNTSGGYFNYPGNNDYGPLQTPATATSPWANF